MEVKFGSEPLYFGQNFFEKNLFSELKGSLGCKKSQILFFYLLYFDTPGANKAQKTGFLQTFFALNKVAQLQILLQHPTTFLTSRASIRKK